MSGPILVARDLARHFRVGGGLFRRETLVRAVDGVSLAVERGETFAIVGESGCGKSTLARLLTRLLRPTAGSVVFEGRDVSSAEGPELAAFRRDVQFVFQDPFSSLNPRMNVGRLVAEPIETHRPEISARARREEVAALLRQVGLRPEHADRYPHEFSGGQRQRIGIARALASGPTLVVGDEPVSALDVSVQAQVLNLLGDLKESLGLTLVIIAHDLAVIRHVSDRVAVMYLGRIVETAPVDEIFAGPRHPYTRALLSAIPRSSPGPARRRLELSGEMPSPSRPPSGCRFHTRCPFAQPDCAEREPLLEPVLEPGLKGDGHSVACHYWRDIGETAEPPAVSGTGLRPEAQRRVALYRSATLDDRTTRRRETT